MIQYVVSTRFEVDEKRSKNCRGKCNEFRLLKNESGSSLRRESKGVVLEFNGP